LELLKSKSKKPILKGTSFDLYSSKKRGGVGISKDIIDTQIFDLDAGIYLTKTWDTMFSARKPELGAGISVRFMF